MHICIYLLPFHARLHTSNTHADIKIVELPMDDVVANALIVNAIQRASTVLVQNSIQEGFGLTATEAMFKRTCFVGTEQAVGLRTQVRHMVSGSPKSYGNAFFIVLNVTNHKFVALLTWLHSLPRSISSQLLQRH